MKHSVLIGITGGSGSGKTSISKALQNVQGSNLVIIEQDSYYKDSSHMSYEERCLLNYDHPKAFDNDLLFEQLTDLLNGKPIEKPVYNFSTHLRETFTETIEPHPIVVLEGILVLEDPRIRELMDIKVFVDTDDDVRVLRRLKRDIRERGRTLDSVIIQYLGSVKPMHHAFTEPTKRYADIIIPEGGENQVAIDILNSKLELICRNHL
ncbi:uridine kinase [Clostridium sp. 'deep sea']|uniref:uridine kinase n=1 Tax=Clostridium sp. 'deep sea' TaxID=2779445 RepID=UPI00189689A0|nr:uridine kinase [Clostridium sp. 'deep sea']QOR35707.1 uridine kinase [Clostridium sp. 'deep sea']